jgi:hypothetical protein
VNETMKTILARITEARPWFVRHRGLIVVLGLAFAFRMVLALKMAPFFGDQPEYLAGANRLLDGLPLPAMNHGSFVRAPGYSIFIAGVWSIIPGRTLVAVRLVQAVISTATCLVTYLLAMRIRNDRRAALVAVCIAAVYPYFLYHVTSIGTECVFAFLVVLGTYCLSRGAGIEEIHWGYLVAGIIVYAVGILVRPNLAPPEAVLGLALAWRYRRRLRTVFAIGSLMIVGTLLVTIPWSVVVERQGMGWVFVSDGGGIWYYMGHNDLAARLYCDHTTDRERAAIIGSSGEVDPVIFVARTLPRSEQARLFWRTALRWDAEHRSRQFCLATGKFWGFWRPWVEPHGYPWKLVAASLTSLPLLALGLIGVWSLRRQDTGLALIVAVNAIGGTLTAMFYSTQVRYRIPVVDSLLVAYAACVVVDFARRAAIRMRPTSRCRDPQGANVTI